MGHPLSRGRAGKVADGREHYPPMTEQHADVLKVLIGQMAKGCETNPVFSQTLGVLGQAELSQSPASAASCRLPATGIAKILSRARRVVNSCGWRSGGSL